MILKDMASARDEATPPEFKELVERYYEVLSKGGARRATVSKPVANVGTIELGPSFPLRDQEVASTMRPT